MSTEIVKVPDIGDASDVEVIELLVSVGDTVAADDSLLVLESDKAAMEIPAPFAGTVKSIAVNLGDKVTTGVEMMTIETEGAAADEDSPESEPETNAAQTPVEPEPVAQEKPAPAAAPAAAASMTLEIPDLGTDDEVEVIEVHVANGDAIAIDDSLVTLESDKAAMEVPATHAGTIEEMLLSIGDKVKTGTPILKLLAEPGGEVTTPAAKPETKAESKPEPAPTPAPASSPGKPESAATPAAAPAAKAGSGVYAGPAVRKLARELGVDLSQVPGSGAKSRIIKEDVQEYVKARLQSPAGTAIASTVPDIDFSQFGEIEQVSRSKLQKITATNMHRNWTAVPHVAQFNEADVTDLEAFRAEMKPEAEKRGTKLTFMPFLLKACAKALQEYPQFNVSLHSSGEYVIQKKYYHIGVAVATEAGLVVPVIRDVNKKSIFELAAEVIELTDKAKSRKLTPDQMQGACFTISSLGAIGGTGFIPIVNAPEVAILGVGKTVTRPVYENGAFVPREMLPLTLSYDHKAVNGVDGGLFSTYLVKLLADIRYLTL